MTMAEIQPTYERRFRYTLRTDGKTPLVIAPPIGYKSDKKAFKRLDSHGVFTNKTGNLIFYKGSENKDGGFNFLESIFQEKGVNVIVELLKEEKNPRTDIFEEHYRDVFDFYTRSIVNNKMSIKFKDNEFLSSLNSRKSKKIELTRLDTMDGVTIDELSTKTMALEGRDILIVDALKNATTENPRTVPSGDNEVSLKETTTSLLFKHAQGGQYEAICIPLVAIAEQAGNVQTVYDYDIHEDGVSYEDGTTGIMFFADSPQITTLKIDMDIEIALEGNPCTLFRLDLVKFTGGISYVFDSYQPSLETTSTNLGGVINFKVIQKEVTLNVGESLALACHSNVDVDSIPAFGGTVIANILKADVTVYNETFFDSSQAKFVLPFEAMERAVHIITGEEDALKSTLLDRTDLGSATDGDAALFGFTSGYWIRRFNDKALTTSFKDISDTLDAVRATGYGVETIGLKKFVRFEERKYFYQEQVLIILPNEVSDVVRKTAKDHFFNSITMGAKKPSGDNLYEEAMGLDEPNTTNTYTTILKTGGSEYKQVSPSRLDDYGPEFARRKSILTNPVEDTRYDNDIILEDLFRTDTEIFRQAIWQDYFEVAPTGIFSPQTLHKANLSPVNRLLRHGWWIRAGLNKYPDSFVNFSSSIGNELMVTKLIGGTERAENGKIQVKELEASRFTGDILEFSHIATTAVLQDVQGFTVIDGNKVQNVYGLIEFRFSGMFHYGYLLELKPNNEGKWTILESTKKPSKVSAQPDPPISPESQGFDYILDSEIN